MNKLHDPLRKVPREIASKIFECEYAFDAYDEPSKDPFALGAVCRSWRAIAWSTPAIWSHVSFCINPPGLEDELPTRLELLGPYFDRSRALPLSIRVYTNNRFQFVQDNQAIERLIEILYECVERWHTLHLQIPVAFLPFFKRRFLDVPPSVFKLKSLSLLIVEELRGQINLDLTPMSSNLQRLYLDGTALTLDSLKVNHAHLTHVTGWSSVDSWMKLFIASPLLEEVDLFEEYPNYMVSTFGPANAITHESLKSLKVTFTYQSPHIDTLFKYSTFPNLNTLLFDSVNCHFEALPSFLGQIRALKVLELWNLISSGTEFARLLPKLPQLEELSIHQVHRMSATDLFNAVFQPEDSLNSDKQVAAQLPNLVSFHYNGSWEKNDHWSFLCHLGNFHCARINLPLSSSSRPPPPINQRWPKLRKISAKVNYFSPRDQAPGKIEKFLDEELLQVAQRLQTEGIEISVSFHGIGIDISDLVEESAKERERIRNNAT
ncbi:hypothetical protein CPB83DRAFT_851426 [Crepidotus variabilis]|uniref:F-box domain-containing protein n=1 Tax=Crepidotus variabilis TaxID=179855 RepID=A0A9P6EJJ4_9AGAR|nr:hypothetical protein CPB83DRAFT_851426 [Crepidotus variabilis]